MKDWYSTIYKACIYAGIVSFIIGFFTKLNTSLDAYITGYSILTLGILMILVILFSKLIELTKNESIIQIIYLLLITNGPFILILGIISFVLYLLINYRNNIIKGHIPPSYNSFTNIIVILLIVEFYLINSNISSEKFETTGKMSKVITNLIYLLGVITSICSIILYIILKYYSTDGFTQMLN
jgi:hypothetical protein